MEFRMHAHCKVLIIGERKLCIQVCSFVYIFVIFIYFADGDIVNIDISVFYDGTLHCLLATWLVYVKMCKCWRRCIQECMPT